MTIKTRDEANEVLDNEAQARQVSLEIVDAVADDAGIPLDKRTWLVFNGLRYLGQPCRPLLRLPGEGA